MSKNQLSESETLDEKIKRIRKKNEEIEKRRLEVEADKQSAAKLNALVQLSAPKEDWPPPRSYISEEDAGRPSVTTEKSRERNRGTVTFDNSLYEGKRPPPDPAYKFLADAERDPVPNKSSGKYQQITQGRGRAAPRSRGRGNKTNIRNNPPLNERGTPGYEAWRAERNRIDEERIQRQRTAQGQWRREWDIQKSEDDWQTPNNDARREQNPAQNNRITPSNASSEFTQRKFMPRSQVNEDEFKRDSGNKKLERNASDMSPDVQSNSLSNSADKPVQPAILSNKSQNSGNTLHVSFVNETRTQKAASRRHVATSGRLGPPPPPPACPRPTGTESGEGSSGAAPQPQRRIREARRRRRATATAGPQRKVSTGDDSWEDADEPSEGEARATATPSEDRATATPSEDRATATPSEDRATATPSENRADESTALKADDSSCLSPHSNNDLTPTLNIDPLAVSQNDCPATPLSENPLTGKSEGGVEANNGDGDQVKEIITSGVEGHTSVMKYNQEKEDNELSIEVLENLDEPSQNEFSTKEENLELAEPAALENNCTNPTQDFHCVVPNVDVKINNGITIVNSSTSTTITESGGIDLERDISVEILDKHSISSIPEDNKLSAPSQDEVTTTNLICGENLGRGDDTFNDYKPCERNHEVNSFQSNINTLDSNNTDCTLTHDRSEEQIINVVEKRETTCDSTECINLSANKEILAMENNFSGTENANNENTSKFIIEDMSKDLIEESKAKENSLIPGEEQIPQPSCPSTDILVDISQSEETKTDLNQITSQDCSRNTDIKTSNSDKEEISRNVGEKLSVSGSTENV